MYESMYAVINAATVIAYVSLGILIIDILSSYHKD